MKMYIVGWNAEPLREGTRAIAVADEKSVQRVANEFAVDTMEAGKEPQWTYDRYIGDTGMSYAEVIAEGWSRPVYVVYFQVPFNTVKWGATS